MGLYLANRHSSGVERQNLVVKAAPAGLVLRNQLRLERAVAITGNLNGQFAELTLQGLPALAVAGVAGRILHRLILAMAEVVGHLRFQRLLDQQLGQLLEQPILANQVFRLAVVSQQAVQ
ncbi:hypothetical protein AT959_02580 [Dechloromonas denitrificans]|uniref:Uncharacterized protein n=1 Tax=Dechloromonas denitrificans TaxID=281362 RepID=A0A133XNT2_9RHOO|nr:hypothetical protein AT959_02580 [Dechloromonas denitrificans]